MKVNICIESFIFYHLVWRYSFTQFICMYRLSFKILDLGFYSNVLLVLNDFFRDHLLIDGCSC
ncbi:hypothetical protein Hdeb2414_s0002g00076601 [Helianthus debilis subsp. tardiflorus]